MNSDMKSLRRPGKDAPLAEKFLKERKKEIKKILQIDKKERKQIAKK